MKRIIACCFIMLSGGEASFSQVWDSLGSGGLVGGAFVTSIYPAFGKLFVGGLVFLPSANGGALNWNGTKWDSLGQGLQFGAAQSFCEYNNELYVGGGFFSWGVPGVPYTDYIAKWNDTVWSAVSVQNPNSVVNAITYRNELYAGGRFSNVGSTSYQKIAKFNGANWSNVAVGVMGCFPPVINTFCQYNGKLIVGGGFNVAGGPFGVECWNVASWDGVKWDTLNGGFDGDVNSFTVDTANNFLYAGGIFLFAENKGMYVQTNFVARWDGYQWSPLGNNTGNMYILKNGVLTLEMYHGELFAGGPASFSSTDTIIARWDGSDWHFLADGYSTIYALKEWRDTLYVGGMFDTIGGIYASNIAQYYSPPDTTCRFLQSLMYAYPPGNPKLYADIFYYNTDSLAVEFYNNIAGASSWQWDFGDGETGTGKTPLHYYTAGTYTVSVIVNYPWCPQCPCIDTVYRTITVINTTGVNELKVESVKFKVYPNPSKGELTVATEEAGIFTVRMTNAQGGELVRKNFTREIKLSVPGLPKGIYHVKVCDEKGVVCRTEKVILE